MAGSLGSGAVWYDPDKSITHFGYVPEASEEPNHKLLDMHGNPIPKTGNTGVAKLIGG